MKIRLILFGILSVMTMFCKAQDQNQQNTDSIIAVQIINPAVQEAVKNKLDPDWIKITQDVEKKYNSTFAERTVTRAQIYLYYGRDWAKFATAIVNYTEKFEDQKNAYVLNGNANFILKYSNKEGEVRKAIEWSKKAIALDPQNESYKKTLENLQGRFRGLPGINHP